MIDELPPCFAAVCPACNWSGRLPSPVFYVRGFNAPIEIDDEATSSHRCPACRKPAYRRLDLPSVAARLRYAIDRLGKIAGRGSDVFSCTCSHTPPCHLVGSVELAITTFGDTVFCNDECWIRICGIAKCNGCYAKGSIALLEKHPWRHIDSQQWYRIWNIQQSLVIE